jgi:hypothetical protein
MKISFCCNDGIIAGHRVFSGSGEDRYEKRLGYSNNLWWVY